MNAKQRIFALEYLVDRNATQAAIRAGYSQRTAGVQGHALLKKPEIASFVAETTALKAEELGISVQWVLDTLKRNAERAMQEVPVYDSDGQATGEYRYEGAVANQALALIGKYLRMFVDRSEVDHGGEIVVRHTPALGAVDVESRLA